MITDDEVVRLFARADPARVDDAAAVADPAVYLTALRTRSSSVTLIDTEPTRTQPPNRHRWLIAAAAAAVVAIVVGGLVLATRDDDPNEQIPAATVAPDPDASAAEAEAIARGFLDAYAAYDADRALTYLTDDAFPDSFESPEALRQELAFFEAQPYKVTILDCQPQHETAAGIFVRCPFEFHFLRSEEIGVGPFGDNYWDLTVRDGKIVSSHESIPFQTNGMNTMWTAFGNWVSAVYPEDAAVMFTDGISSAVHSEESARLWALRSQDFVQAVLTGPETYAADVGAICAAMTAQLAELAVPAEGAALDQVAAWNTAVATIMDETHGELIALVKPPLALVKPPRADPMTYTNFYGRLIRLAGVVEESAAAAVAGDATRLAELDAEYAEVRQVVSNVPEGSGLEECAANLPR